MHESQTYMPTFNLTPLIHSLCCFHIKVYVRATVGANELTDRLNIIDEVHLT
jgi:hypothetical protein